MFGVLVQFAVALNSRRVTGSGPLKRAVRKKLAGKGWPGRSSRSIGQGAAVFEGGRVRLQATTAGQGAMMAALPSEAGGFATSGLSVRKSEDIADLIDLFSKMQYRAKEVTPRVSLGHRSVNLQHFKTESKHQQKLEKLTFNYHSFHQPSH